MKPLVALLHDCKNDIPGVFLAAHLVLHRASSRHTQQPRFGGETLQIGAGEAEKGRVRLGIPEQKRLQKAFVCRALPL